MADTLPGVHPEGPCVFVENEVETELEDNDEEERDDAAQVALDEVPEDVGESADVEDDEDYLPSSRPVSATSSRPRPESAASGHGSARERSQSQNRDCQVADGNRELWKQFGCNTKAGRALRGLYSSGNRVHDAHAKVTYPRLEAPSQKWEPKALPRKPCPQRTAVRVPRPTARKPLDRDDPRNWPADLACPKRRPGAEILAEMEAAKPEIPDLPQGRDQGAEKERLQDNFRFCGGRMMPKGAMGNVPAGQLPKALERVSRDQMDSNGMTAEHREIFQELVLSVQRKQARIAEIDAEDEADPKPSKKKTERNKEALELKNAIDVCLKDIDRLLAITADDAA